MCVSVVPSSLSCHFTASQVSPKQTDASLPTSPLFAAHSITGHTLAHELHAQLWYADMRLIVNKNTRWQSFIHKAMYLRTHTHTHTHTQCLTQLQACWRKWPSQLLLSNCSIPQHTHARTHTHAHTHTHTFTHSLSLPTFPSNSIPFFQSTTFYSILA